MDTGAVWRRQVERQSAPRHGACRLGSMSDLRYRLHALVRRFQRQVLVALAALLVVGIGVVRYWHAAAERRAIARMPHEERRALFEQTRWTVELLCAPRPIDAGLRGRCEDLGSFLAAFPECDAECSSLASVTHRHTR
jgi:hypothetical protein